MDINWIWNPGQSIGPFYFGDRSEGVIDRLGLIKLEPDCVGAYWDSYAIPGYESLVTIKEDKITSVSCWDQVLLDGSLNLLGLHLDQVRRLLGPEDAFEEHKYIQGNFLHHYNSLGLTLFSKDEKVRNADCQEKWFLSDP